MARLVVEHPDFTLSFHCAKLATDLRKAAHNGLTDAQLYSDYSWSGSVDAVKIEKDTGDEQIEPKDVSAGGSTEVAKGAPFFFDNTAYKAVVEMKAGCEDPWADGRSVEFEDTVFRRKDFLTGTLQFRNDIGKSDFRFGYSKNGERRTFRLTFHVLSTKLDYHHDWKNIVEDIEDEYRMLSYDFLKRTYHAFQQDSDGETSDMIWWKVFEKHRAEFIRACRLIMSRPRARYRKIDEYRRADQLKVLSPALENEFGEYRQMDSHLYLDSRGAQTKDTVENRFFKFAVETISRKHETLSLRVNDEAAKVAEGDESGAAKRAKKFKKLAEEVRETTDSLRQIRNNPFFRGIGKFECLRQVSLVLQKAPGYASMTRIYALLNAMYDLQDGLYGLETKNIADLYELWCFIEVKNQVAAALGVEKKNIKHTNRTEMGNWFGEDPKKGKQSRVMIESADKTVRLEVLYNAAATLSGKSGIEKTIAPTGGDQKPDIVMRLVREYGSEKAFKLTYIFDAKYRLDDEDSTTGVGAPPDDAINQLHRYRDAIYYGEVKDGPVDADIKKEVIGGYILFPGSGTKAEIEESTLFKSIGKVNIGALPLRPGYEIGRQFLCDFIKHLVEKPTADHLTGLPSQALKGTTQIVADPVSQVGCIAGLFAGSTVIDHLATGVVSFIGKHKIYVKTADAKPLNAEAVKWGFIFDASNAALGVVVRLECLHHDIRPTELLLNEIDGYDYDKVLKAFGAKTAPAVHVWKVKEIVPPRE